MHLSLVTAHEHDTLAVRALGLDRWFTFGMLVFDGISFMRAVWVKFFLRIHHPEYRKVQYRTAQWKHAGSIPMLLSLATGSFCPIYMVSRLLGRNLLPWSCSSCGLQHPEDLAGAFWGSLGTSDRSLPCVYVISFCSPSLLTLIPTIFRVSSGDRFRLVVEPLLVFL